MLSIQLENELPLELPKWFNYKPVTFTPRVTFKQSQKAVFVQESLPRFVSGKTLDWSIDIVDTDLLEELNQLHLSGGCLTFTGKLGEQFGVEFIEFQPICKGGIWSVTGKFRVVCILADPKYNCED